MTLREEQEKVQKAMNAALSGLQEDPWLAQRVLANAKGEMPVKKKLIPTLVLSIILILALVGTAVALSSSQVAEYFKQHWNQDLGEWLEHGKVAQVGESTTLAGVEFTLDEVVYRNRGIYAVGTARAVDDKDVLLPMDLVDGWECDLNYESEEGRALVEKAKSAGGRLLSIDSVPERIGVDGGSMVNVGDIGMYNQRNADGTLTFSFETGGYALEDGTTYQMELSIDVDEWTEKARKTPDEIERQIWTVQFEPVIIAEEKQQEAPVQTVIPTETDYELVVPTAYQETGTLPVYRAMENDFIKTVKPEWFNPTGIAEKKSDRHLVFNDHAELSVSPEAIYYAEYTDELFDYNTLARETYDPDIKPMLMPRQAISQAITDIASGAYHGWKEYTTEIQFEKEQLTLLSLADARRTAETLFGQLGLQGLDLAYAVDMSVDRIKTLGEAYNHYWFDDPQGFTNAPRQDFTTATAEDEGYFLVYTPLGVTNISDSRHDATLYVTGRGIAFANIGSTYKRGEALYTPDALIAPEEAVKNLYKEIAKSLYKDEEKVTSISRVALTYVAVRAENKKDGMVFAPVWQVLYHTEQDPDDPMFAHWAEFNALNGTLVNAVFR